MQFVQDVGNLEIMPGCPFNITQVYVSFRPTIQFHWNNNGSVWWFPFIVGEVIVPDHSTEEYVDRFLFYKVKYYSSIFEALNIFTL